MKIIRCPNCNSEIAVDKHTIYPIDCSCGCAIYKDGKHAMEYNPVNEDEWTKEQLKEAKKVWQSMK